MMDYIKALDKERVILVTVVVVTIVAFTAVIYITHHDSSDKLECFISDDCPNDMTCMDRRCKDPCTACGNHTSCYVSNHVPYCMCVSGFIGDPVIGCTPGKNTKEGPVYSISCNSDVQCSVVHACVNNKCQDPCKGVCGTNTICHVKDHRPACACSPGYTGNPFQQCSLHSLEQSQLNSSSTRIKLPSVPPEGKTFRLFTNERINWFKALDQCSKLGLRLATIDNDVQHRTLITLIESLDLGYDTFWLSGTDLGHPGTYQWITTGKPMTYTDWFMGEPNHKEINNEVEHCVELRSTTDHKFNDQACSFTNYYICENY